jgi:cytochrome c oxidase subunit 7
VNFSLGVLLFKGDIPILSVFPLSSLPSLSFFILSTPLLPFHMAFPVAPTVALKHSIAPIKGGLKRRALTDITVGLALGTACGYAYWYGIRLPSVARREAYYAKLAAEKE